MNVRLYLLRIADGILIGSITVLVLGTTLAFGGAVWWARAVIAVFSMLLVLGGLLRILLDRSMRILKSPLTFLGALALGIAIVQLAPLPSSLASRLSPNAQAAYSRG